MNKKQQNPKYLPNMFEKNIEYFQNIKSFLISVVYF